MQITTNAQKKDWRFIRDAKNYAAGYKAKNKLSNGDLLDHITDLYRDQAEIVIDENRKEIFLNMDVFELSNISSWFRDFCTLVDSGKRPRVRTEATGRFIAFTSILRANDPEGTSNWGNEPDY